jgi:hypothetical protein
MRPLPSLSVSHSFGVGTVTANNIRVKAEARKNTRCPPWRSCAPMVIPERENASFIRTGLLCPNG